MSTRLLGYTGEVALDNTGDAVAKDWNVVVTLTPGSALADVNGADWQQNGATVTFTGQPIPAGQSRKITFDVRDASPAKGPASCTVGRQACAGL